MSLPEPNSNPHNSHKERMWCTCLLAATALNCLLQIAWFWRFRAHNITEDGIAYVGLARHLVDGNVKLSLHGYWSPLTSWIIALSAVFSRNFTLLGRLVTIASFLLCLPFLYHLTLKLWRSKAAAALAVFWFSVGRALVATAVGSILADFVLTVCVLLYFSLLLDALRRNEPGSWARAGAAHALAFLAKAIAMPWLSISSAIAVLWQNPRSPRRLVSSLLLAFLFPGIVWFGWGMALRTKYGVFTTGYQLRGNLIINWRRHLSHHPRGDDLAFVEVPSLYDNYMVDEPWSSLQSFHLQRSALLIMIMETEIQNLPSALKQTSILLTPAGILALAVMLLLLIRDRRHAAETAFALIACLSSLALIVAYCMLVFDGRYVIPIAPVLIAISCPLVLPADVTAGAPRVSAGLQKAGLGLLAGSVVFFAVYWASPFRTVDRDFEASCYQAASVLRNAEQTGTLVSIGDGPYPEHGVGFEMGPYVAYLAGWRLVGGNAALPADAGADTLADQALAAKADAVAVWGSAADPAYVDIAAKIRLAPQLVSARPIADPYKGEVGTLFLFRRNR
ncbi:MAG: glycosyltransferase family 39 protein [Thermoplasmata archaeon]